ncbi:MAG: hypothetical protein DSZ07_03615 [Sulfurovum sp.]|nr:MAG: hypothetical protein DSZ07_03615 [Sulfurovum sp.]
MNNKILTLTSAILLSTAFICANDSNETVVPTKHNKKLTLSTIAEIQLGRGTVMMEFGHRFYVAYYAAKTSNWELAKYQIDELIEAQEIVEATRPQYAKQLKAFEDGAITNLQKSIETKECKLFFLF